MIFFQNIFNTFNKITKSHRHILFIAAKHFCYFIIDKVIPHHYSTIQYLFTQ